MKKLNDSYIFFGKGGDWVNALFDDIDDEHFLMGKDPYCPCWQTKFSNLLCRFVWGSKFGKIDNTNLLSRHLINIMCKRIAKKYPNGAICIFHRSNPLSQNEYFLKRIRTTNPKCKLVYWFTDIVKMVELNIKNILTITKEYYDLVITYEKNDALTYGFYYVETPYSFLKHINNLSETKDIDLLYVGKSKIDVDPSRFDKIIKIYELAKAKGLKTYFAIADVPEKNQKYKTEIIYNKIIDYNLLVETIKKAKCILEVSQLDEKGTTLRLFESIAYDTHLVFTNDNLLNHPYFQSEYMHFVDCSDINNVFIDFGFLKNSKIKYSNSLKEAISPYSFLIKISKLVKEKENY